MLYDNRLVLEGASYRMSEVTRENIYTRRRLEDYMESNICMPIPGETMNRQALLSSLAMNGSSRQERVVTDDKMRRKRTGYLFCLLIAMDF